MLILITRTARITALALAAVAFLLLAVHTAEAGGASRSPSSPSIDSDKGMHYSTAPAALQLAVSNNGREDS